VVESAENTRVMCHVRHGDLTRKVKKKRSENGPKISILGWDFRTKKKQKLEQTRSV
jgi:hypothetical protein